MRDLEPLFTALSRSAFRSKFHLLGRDREYLESRGLPTILEHATDFISKRLAPADPANDGRQTPFRGHPVFVAQHATACCCRGCLEKWHRIPKGRALSSDELDYIVRVLERWLIIELDSVNPA
ncbi:MAG: DUF4186 domain-containing protein [Gammaproteobacteria bacterium]